jgi:hypothetical protein
VWIRARNADARALYWHLAKPSGIEIWQPGPEVSFRAEGSLAQLIDRLRSFQGSRAPLEPSAKTGSRPITVVHYRIEVALLARLLARVGNVNIIVSQNADKRINSNLLEVPWLTILETLTSALDLSLSKLSSNTYLISEEPAPASDRRFGRTKMSLRTNAALPLGALLDLLQEATGESFSTEACSAMIPETRLVGVMPPVAHQALTVLAKAEIQAAPTQCPRAPWLALEDLQSEMWKLRATASTRKRSVALLQRGKDFGLARDRPHVTVRETGLWWGKTGKQGQALHSLIHELLAKKKAKEIPKLDVRATAVIGEDAFVWVNSKDGPQIYRSAPAKPDDKYPTYKRDKNKLTFDTEDLGIVTFEVP